MRAYSQFIILLFFALTSPAVGQDTLGVNWQQESYSQRPKIGLALSGGAAHGLAHIGLLKYLEEIGIPIDNITGTSMGAVIGGLYAIGYDADQCIKIASEIDWDDVLSSKIYSKDVSPVERYSHGKYPLSIDYRDKDFIIPEGIINSNKLDLLLEELFAPAYLRDDFDDFAIPYRCYGVDIVDGTIVEMKSGRLSEAVRASMAIPSIFSPREIDGRMIVDGGLIRNFPVTNNYEMGSNIVIGSYVGSDRGDAGELNSLFDILKQSAFMMSISDSEDQEKHASIMIRPIVDDMSTFGFGDHDIFIERGYQAAKAKTSDFKKLKTILDNFDSPAPKPVLDPTGFIFINTVIVKDMSQLGERIIKSKLSVKNRSFTTFSKINDGIKSIYATKSFDNVKYYLSPSEDGTNLIIEGTEIKQTTIGVNINHFASTSSAIIVDMQARNYVGEQSNINLKLRVGENYGVAANYYKRDKLLKEGLLFGINTKIEKSELPFYRDNKRIYDTDMWEGLVSPFVMWEANNRLSLKAYWQARYTLLDNSITGTPEFDSYVQRQQSTGLELEYNTLDKAHFAKSGIRLRHSIRYVYKNNTSIEKEGPGDIEFIKPGSTYLTPSVTLYTINKLAKKLHLESIVSGQYRKTGYFIDNQLIGGVYQDKENRLPFVGMKESQLMVATYAYARLALRWQAYNNLYTSLVINGIAGNNPVKRFVGGEYDTDFSSELGVGFSIGLDLPFGPLYFDIAYLTGISKVSPTIGIGYRHIW